MARLDTFIYKEDRKTLLKMILEVCCIYNESYNHTINHKDSENCITYLFFMSRIIQQQKLINRIGKDDDEGNVMNLGKDSIAGLWHENSS